MYDKSQRKEIAHEFFILFIIIKINKKIIMNDNRFFGCTKEGHNKDLVTHLCVYEDYKLKNQ